MKDIIVSNIAAGVIVRLITSWITKKLSIVIIKEENCHFGMIL